VVEVVLAITLVLDMLVAQVAAVNRAVLVVQKIKRHIRALQIQMDTEMLEVLERAMVVEAEAELVLLVKTDKSMFKVMVVLVEIMHFLAVIYITLAVVAVVVMLPILVRI
jgi:hypothetical protein|tara:strand:- start:106 stop:435 length:330 start_codon:yes stop_codon:yes gene_type:complete